MRKRQKLTDTALRACKPASKGSRYEIMDTERRRLGIRVTDKGHLSFIYRHRFPGGLNVTRRRIGDYPTTSLAEAREIAERWDRLIAKGVDPKVEERRISAEAERAKKADGENVFAVRAEEYLRRHCKHHRQVKETARIIEKELAPLAGRQLDDISSRDLKELTLEIAERSPSMARNVLTVLKSFFSWAEELEFIETSPAASIRPNSPHRREEAQAARP